MKSSEPGCLIFQDLHCAGSFRGSDHDFVLARDKLVIESLGHAESPIAAPTPKLLPIVERDRVVVAVIVMEMAAKFLQADLPVKLRESAMTPSGCAVPS